jgi:outer membrane lipoprotein SlyB|uniref:outer membrane lipoprotein n=1 Tax=Hylemonella sp. TaxID=2066020 RepID=UPI0035ADFD9B
MMRIWMYLPALLLAGCATSSPDVIQRGDAQRLSTVVDAVVLSVRAVTVEGSQSGVGAAAGGAVGGIAGYGAGSSQREAQVIGIVGAVAGAVAGNVIERAGTREEAYEILVQLKNGERRAIVQAKGAEVFEPGEAVILITTSGKVRVAKAPKM